MNNQPQHGNQLEARMNSADLSEPARRVLGHITGRTRQGKFACRLWNMTDAQWYAALEELRAAGLRFAWTYGTVADEPTVTGGWVLAKPDREPRSRGPAPPPLSEAPHSSPGRVAAVTPQRTAARVVQGRDRS